MKLRLYGPNILGNGGAERGSTSSWGLYYNTASAALAALSVNTTAVYSGSYDFYVDVKSAGTGVDAIQMYQQNVRVPAGGKMSLQFAGRGEDIRNVRVNYMLGMDPYTLYFWGACSLTAVYQLFEKTFTIATQVDSGSVRFYCGSWSVLQDLWLDEIGLRNYVELPTTYEYSAAENLTRKDVRTKAGNLYSYIEPVSFRRFTLPLVHVNNADRSLINSWWATGSELRFVEDSTYPFSFSNVRIVGEREPLTKFMRPYNNEYEGELVLETV